MSQGWRTLSDGRKVLIELRASNSSKPSLGLWNNCFSDKALKASMLGLTRCYWCSEAVYFVRSKDGGCFLSDSIPPPTWELHACWLKYQKEEGINEKISDYYKQIGVKPRNENRTSSQKLGETYKESLENVLVSSKVEITAWFLIHSVYNLKVLLDGQKYAIVRLQRKTGAKGFISCLIRASLVKRGCLVKRETYRLKVSTVSYGEDKLIYISRIIEPMKINVHISKCNELRCV